MTILAVSVTVAVLIGWLATLGVVLYAVVTENYYVEEASFALVSLTFTAAVTVAVTATLLKH